MRQSSERPVCFYMSMSSGDLRRTTSDRRRVARGGRRPSDRAGKYPPVLIAESYEGVRQSCSRYLDRFNFEVVQAANGEQALAHIAAAPPQIILTELNLPAMPARRLSRWLSQSWRTRHIPLIVLGGDLDPSKAGYEELRPHAAAVLLKPFSLRSMLEEIRRVLRDTPEKEPTP